MYNIRNIVMMRVLENLVNLFIAEIKRYNAICLQGTP